MKSVYLFQKDLRLEMNPLIAKAIQDSSDLTFAFVKPIDFDASDSVLGFDLWSKAKKKFFLQALKSLADSLQNKGYPFIYFENTQYFHKYLTDEKIEALYATDSPFSYENEFKVNLNPKIKLSTDRPDLLINFEALNFTVNTYTSFTKFRKIVEKNKWPVQKAVSREVLVMSPSSDFSATSTVLSWCENILQDLASTELAFDLHGDREFALKHLQDYVWTKKHINQYKATRNGMIEFYDSSKLSSWLAIGVLSPVEVFQNILDFEDQQGSNSSTYWLKLELLWREYFKWMAETCGDLFFKVEGLTQDYIDPEFDSKTVEVFEDWTKGKTKHPFINANMVELKQTGFMSNRGRQNVASYLTHELDLPWHWGAKWFESQLIDYDPSSNYGNWQYVSGVGGWGEHKFDYDWQSNTYDPEKKYQKYWNSKKTNFTNDVN